MKLIRIIINYKKVIKKFGRLEKSPYICKTKQSNKFKIMTTYKNYKIVFNLKKQMFEAKKGNKICFKGNNEEIIKSQIDSFEANKKYCSTF